MTASVANGFGHILYEPDSRHLPGMAPYAFHPEYSTANPRGNTWSAHTYNVAMSDEIGHFENCLERRRELQLRQAGSAGPRAAWTRTTSNNFCVPGADSTADQDQRLLQRGRGLATGSRTSSDWPGTDPNVHRDQAVAPIAAPVHEPAHEQRTTNYSDDRVRDRSARGSRPADSQDNPPFCDRDTGANCVNPPNGAQFYPFLLDADCDTAPAHGRRAVRFIPGTTNDFGGSSTAEFGPLLKTVYPAPGLHNSQVDSTTSTAET